jgi:large repetitive protein
MATASQNTSLILKINGTPNVALKRGQKNSVTAKAGQRYRVVNEGEETAAKDGAKDVAASQQGQDLLLSYADGTQVALVNFYEACKAEQCAVDMPGAKGTGTSGGYVITGESPVGASLSDGSKLVYAHGDTASMAALTQGAGQAPGFSTQDSLITYIPSSDAGAWTPLHAGLGVLGAAALLHHDGKAAPVPTIIHGSVVAGPVVAGNGLTAVAYKADGTVLASGVVGNDGTFILNVGNDYRGPVLVKVSDANSNPDYWDEATGAPKDLTTDLRALTVIPAAGTYNVSVNVLTELAVRSLGLAGGDTGNSITSFASVSQTQIVQANQHVATAVGLAQDLVLGAAPVAIVTTDGTTNAQTNDYGRLLAALSGAEVGSNTNAVLDDLVEKLQSTQAHATGQVLETLLEGAAKVNLVAAVSDITNQKSTAITIDAVAQDNRLTPAEMIAGVQVHGTTAASASVTLSWSDSSGAAQTTGTRTVTADAQGHWSTSFSSEEMPALGATTLTATVGNAAATRSIYLDAPSAPTLALTTVTGSNGQLTRNGHVDVSDLLSGAGWDYSLDGGTNWTAGSGTGFTVTGDGIKQVLVRQNIGGHTSAASRLDFELDTTVPSALSFALSTDSGTSSSDGISDTGTVTVSGLESGATWQYSTDSGSTWTAGSGTSFVLAAGTHAAGTVQTRQSDAAGNISNAISNASAITVDATAPAAPSFALSTDSGTSSSDGISNDGTVSVSGLESGATWQYSTDSGSTWTAGSGTSFVLAAGTHAAGTVQTRQSDAAGNISNAISNASAITVDATAPTVAITSSATSLGAGATATLTFTLSDASTDFTQSDVTVTGGTLSNWSGSGASYTATFTPDSSLTGSATVSVATNVLSDAAGNANTAASNTVTLVVDTEAPTVSSNTTSRTSLIADQTAIITITLSEASTNFTVADLEAVGGTLSNFSGSGTTYTVTFTPESNRTDPGSVGVKRDSFSDASGNAYQSIGGEGVVMAISTVRPTATLVARQTDLGVGSATTIDITLSEPATDFTLADLTASHGTLSEFTPQPGDDGTHYSVVFTPEANYTGTGGVTLADGRFTNAAGNANGGAIAPAGTGDLAIDTTPPSVTITSDVSALAIGQTATITFTFSKDPGNSFDASDIKVNGGTLSRLTNHTGKIWTAHFTPTDDSSGQASITVGKAQYTDAAGNLGAAGTSPTLTLDTQGPVAELSPANATTVLPGKDLVLNFSEAVHVGGGDLVLVDDTANTRANVAINSNMLSNNGQTLTITPSSALVAGHQYHVEADPGSLHDAAGNAWAGIASTGVGNTAWSASGWHFTAATPSVSLNRITADNFVNNAENTAGVVINGTIESNTAGMVADFVANDFTVTLTPQGGGSTITANASSYNSATGAWSLTLANNALVHSKTYDVSVSVTGSSVSGPAHGATATTSGSVLVDLTAVTPTLALFKDTGVSNSDGITSNAGITVAGLETGASWEFNPDNHGWYSGSGTSFGMPQGDGAHTVQVRQTDGVGNVSAMGTLSFVLDTTADRPVINAIATDNIINASEVGTAITGTAEAGASVQLVLGTGEQARTVAVMADGSGNWTHTLGSADLAALGTGQTQVTAVQIDKAGNESYATLKNLTVDTVAPTVTLSSNQDRLSAGQTAIVTFSFSEDPGSSFTSADLTVSGGTLGALSGSGLTRTATFTPTPNATGVANISVTAASYTDAVGNLGQVDNRLNLSADTLRPTVDVSASSSTLGPGQVSTLTFTLSEASDSFGADSVTVVGGALGALSANAARTVYTGVFTPDANFFGNGSISVADGAFRDRGGNGNTDGNDTDNSVSLIIQSAPTTLAITSDKTELKAGETATLTFTFSSAPTGFAAADIAVTGGTLSALTVNPNNASVYTATFTPTANAAEGMGSVTVLKGSYTGQGGLSGGGAKLSTLNFDTQAPTLVTLNPEDGGFLAASAGASLVATFSEDVLIGSGDIRLVDDTSNTTQTFAVDSSAIAIDGKTLTLTPTTALVAGHNYHLSIDATALVDAAGNAYVGIANATSWNFAATNLSTTIDPVSGDNRINNAEKTASDANDLIVITGKLSSVNPAVLSALVASDITVTLTVPRDGGWNDSSNKIIGTTETYDSATGIWTATVPKNWVYDAAWPSNDYSINTYVNGDTDTVKVTVTGRSGTAAAGLSVTLTDTLVVDLSTPSTPTLTLAGDTGSSTSDEITSNGLINVGALEAGATWQYSVDNGGTWQTGAGSSFALSNDVTTTVKVRQSDAAGNPSAEASLAIKLDTQANAPVIDTVAGDNFIKIGETSSAITGTAEAGASVSLVIGANTRTVTANGSGVWSYTLQAADMTAMGQGAEVLSATQTDKAGNTSAAGIALIQVDTVAPTVTLASSSASLLAGQSATVTVTLSEAVPSFLGRSLTVSGGTLGELMADASGLVYTGIFTPSENSTTAASIQLASGALSDAAGNANTSASNALAISVNTVQPTVAITSNVANGATLHAGETALLTFTLSTASSDFADSDVMVKGGSLSNWAGSGSSYTATFTPDANSTAPASVSIASGVFSNAAGNANADALDTNNSVSFVIATVRPSLTISSDVSTLGGGQSAIITFQFSEDPGSSFVWDGSTGDITVSGGTLSAIRGSGLTRTATFTPTSGFSGAATISVADGSYTNSAGSTGQVGSSPALTIDAVAPTVAIGRSGSATLATGETDTITFDFSEAPGESFSLADVDVSGGTLGALSAVSATRYVASFTPTASAAGTAKISVANSRFSDVAGNTNTDGADANNLLSIAYSTGGTAASTPMLSLAADTGASNSDGLTNNGLVNVDGLSASTPWEYSLDSGSNWLSGTGSSFLLSAGSYSAGAVKVRQNSIEGSLAAAVEYRAAYTGNPVMALVEDSGRSASDGITNHETVTLSGLATTDTWRVSSNNGLSWSGWSSPPPSNMSLRIIGGSDGVKNLLLEFSDIAGNTLQKTFSFTLDTQAPVSLNTKLTPALDDGGAIVAATNIEAGALVEYRLTSGTSAGSWSTSYTAPTAAGNYILYVRQTDVAGNSSEYQMSPLAFSVTAASPIVQLSAIAGGTGGFVINGGLAGDSSGRSVSSAGDVNGDGLADLIVGAYLSDPTVLSSDAGRSYVVFGKTSTAGIELSNLGAGGFVINGECSSDQSGFSVSGAGDVNGDGLPDLLIGAPGNKNGSWSASGRSYVVFGKTSNTDIDLSNLSTAGFVINGSGACSASHSGWSVSNAGDVNGDGLADLIIGAPGENFSTGVSYVVFGKSSNSPINLAAVAGGIGGFQVFGDSDVAFGEFGDSVSSAGDVNGDGLADLIIGAKKYSSGSGLSYVVFGKTSGSPVDARAINAGWSGGFLITGQNANDNSGCSVSSAGDVNGDGLADLVVGAYKNDPAMTRTDAGRSYVVFGKTSFNAINLSALAAGAGGGFSIIGENGGDNSGTSVSSAGDFNGDGLADLIVGASGSGIPTLFTGRSYVVFGKTGALDINLSAVAAGSGGFAINGQCRYDTSGYSVSSAGDVNGDGLTDLIVGAKASDPTLSTTDAGRSYVIFGNTTGAVGTGTLVDWLGTDGADTQSDGGTVKTLVAGAGNDTLTATAASVLMGGAGNDSFSINQAMATALQSAFGQGGNSTRLARIDGGTGTDTLVLAANTALDLTKVVSTAAGDPEGTDRVASIERVDLSAAGSSLTLSAIDVAQMAGMNSFNSGNGWSGLGASVARHQLVITGTAGTLNLQDSWAYGGTATDGNGASYKVYNGERNTQLLLGVGRSLPGSAIELSAIAGGTGGFVINGQAALDYSGYSVSSAGDVNGDGLTDLIIGAYASDPSVNNSDAGRSYVVFGKTTSTRIDLSAVAAGTGGFVINGQCADDTSGNSVSSAGDVNGDGLADLIVGAKTSTYPTSFYNSGRSYVVFGKTSVSSINLSAVANGNGGFVINAQCAYDYSGTSVSSAGDVNGDGLADLIVAAPNSDPAAGESAGRSYVVFGKTTSSALNLSDVARGIGGFVINGQCSYDFSGASVSSAGDVNGDGLADLIVGAYGSDPAAGGLAGRSYVVFGKTSGSAINLSAVAANNGGFVINGQCRQDHSGYSVSSAGDVNGDGLADLIVGAPYSDPAAGNAAGCSYVVFGKTASTAIDLSAVAAGNGGFVINGQCELDSSGYNVSGAGDVNGDGLADLIVGAYNADDQKGRSYVVFGKSTSTAINLSAVAAGDGGFVINGQCFGDQSGFSVASAGDVNGDGLADLIVGANWSDPATFNKAGSSYVIFGSTSNTFMPSTPAQMGTTGNDSLSDNGLAQLLVGAGGNDSFTATAASVLHGGAGSDTFVINQTMVTALQTAYGQTGNNGAFNASIEGGHGGINSVNNPTNTGSVFNVDTLRLSGTGITLDLTQVSNIGHMDPELNSRLSGIELIDLGSTTNTLKLTAKDVLDISDAVDLVNVSGNADEHQLVIKGASGAKVYLDVLGGTGWKKISTVNGGNWGDASTTYDVYADNSSEAMLLVQQGLNVYDAAPVASLTAAAIPYAGNAIARSSEPGTAYLVNSNVTVTNLASITGAVDNQWNSVAIAAANTDTSLSTLGLADGSYKLYAKDSAGNLSAASTEVVSIDNTVPTATVTSATLGASDSANVSSTEPGMAYLVNTNVAVNNLASITGAADNLWNSSAISSANSQTAIAASGLVNGLYKAYSTDAAGNISAASSASVTIPYVLGQATISLGSSGQLIFPVQVDGNWYYYWDRNADGVTGIQDQGALYILDDVFSEGMNGPPFPTGSTDNSHRYATINGVRLALPTYGSTVDGSGNANHLGTQQGTAVANGTTNNDTYNDLLAVWDAFNGSSVQQSVQLSGIPTGWAAGAYWSATPGIVVDLQQGGQTTWVNETQNYHVALQVL